MQPVIKVQPSALEAHQHSQYSSACACVLSAEGDEMQLSSPGGENWYCHGVMTQRVVPRRGPRVRVHLKKSWVNKCLPVSLPSVHL